MEIFKYDIVVLLLVLIVQINSSKVVLYDMPKCGDLESYLGAVERAIHFVETVEVDVNIAFSLLSARANFMHAHNTLNLSRSLLERLHKIGATIENLVYRDDFPLTGPWREDLGITKLFNLTHVATLSQKPIKQPALTFDDPDEYIMEEFITSPITFRLSEFCMQQFQNLGFYNETAKCPVDKKCLYFVARGSNYAYSITHRLLFLILANSRGCYIFSPEDDKILKHRFCSAIYSETLYLVYYDYLCLDLIMESVFLCSSLGYTQFLSRNWFKKLLRIQSNYGCFETDEFVQISRKLEDISYMSINVTYAQFLMDRNCDLHLTAVTLGALAVAARYTMQKCNSLLSDKTSEELYDTSGR